MFYTTAVAKINVLTQRHNVYSLPFSLYENNRWMKVRLIFFFRIPKELTKDLACLLILRNCRSHLRNSYNRLFSFYGWEGIEILKAKMSFSDKIITEFHENIFFCLQTIVYKVGRETGRYIKRIFPQKMRKSN